MGSSTTLANWVELLYSWDDDNVDLYTDNQYTEYGTQYQLPNFEKTFKELENFISELSVKPARIMKSSQTEVKTVTEPFDYQTIVVFCGLGTNTLLLALLLIGLAIKMRYFRECWRNWPRIWIVSALTVTHILLLFWVRLRRNTVYKDWSIKGIFACLTLSSLETMLCFGGILYIVLLGAHTCFQVFVPRILIGPRQFVTWVSMTIFLWMVAIPVAVFVRRPYTGIYESLFSKHCIMDSEAGFISLIVYTYAIPFCVLFGMICSCVIGVCHRPKNTKEKTNTNHVITTDVMILRWVRKSRTWAVIFLAVMSALSFIARVPLFIARVYEPYKDPESVDIAQTIFFGHYAVAPFCMFILKDVRDLFSSICMCCRCGCARAARTSVEPLSIRVQ